MKTLDCFEFYLWSTGQMKLCPLMEKEVFKEITKGEIYE
jgi:hypothetical protein